MKCLPCILLALVLLVTITTPIAAQAPQEWPEGLTGRLAFQNRDTHCIDLYNFDTQEITQCITPQGSYDPDFSPDGTTLAFVQGSNPTEGYNIFLLDISTDQITQVTYGEHVYDHPSWSPDGTRLLIHTFPTVSAINETNQTRGEGPSLLAIVDLQNENTVTDLWNWRADYPFSVFTMDFPDWADNEHIVFNAQKMTQIRPRAFGLIPHILTAPLDELESAHSLTTTMPGLAPNIDFTPVFFYPAVSPDGTRLAFSASIFYPNDPYDIYVIDLETGFRNELPLTDNFHAFNPTWSPDGNYLAFSNPDGLFVIPSDGSAEPTLIANGSHPTWAP